MMNVCKFCGNAYKSEQTLSKHMCVKKKRAADKDTVGSQLGFRVFQRFYELTTSSKRPKSFEEFISSQYYISFVKFGRHLIDLNPIDSNSFVDYVIKNGIKMPEWFKDKTYTDYLKIHMGKEPADRAVERTIIEISSWAESNGKQLKDFFTCVNTIEALYLIRSGRISPWVLYLADTSGKLLADFTPEQMSIIKEIIDPMEWQKVFMKNENDVMFVKDVLRQAEL